MFLPDKNVNPTQDLKPFTFEHFVRWLERQNPKTTYDYLNSCDCLHARYNKAHGRDYITVMFVSTSGKDWSDEQKIENCASWGNTYGEALACARKIQAGLPT